MNRLRGGLIQMSLKGDTSMSPKEIADRMLAAHLPLIVLMIVAGEMQHSVQHQHFHLDCEAVPLGRGLDGCGLKRDGQIASTLHQGGKRQHIGGLVEAPELKVHCTYSFISSQKDGELAGQPKLFPDRGQELVQVAFSETGGSRSDLRFSSFDNNHLSTR